MSEKRKYDSTVARIAGNIAPALINAAIEVARAGKRTVDDLPAGQRTIGYVDTEI